MNFKTTRITTSLSRGLVLLMLILGCSGLWLNWDWPMTELRLNWDWTETGLWLNWDWTETGLGLNWDWHETDMRLTWDWPETVLWLAFDWTKTCTQAPCRLWQVVNFLHSSRPGLHSQSWVHNQLLQIDPRILSDYSHSQINLRLLFH